MAKILEQVVEKIKARGHEEREAWAICRAANGMSDEGTEAELLKNSVELSEKIKAGTLQFALPDTKDISGVEIFAAGKWNGDTYTEKDIEELVQNFQETKKTLKPYLKLGHDKNQKLAQTDGLPSLGWIENVYKVGNKLVADFKDIPSKIYDLIKKKAYSRVSSEIFMGIEIGGKKFGKALKAVALLGGDTPAVKTLDDIISLYASHGEAKVYGAEFTAKTYELEQSELSEKGDDEMKTIEQLTAELAEANVKLTEALNKVKDFTVASDKDKTTIAGLNTEVATLKTSKDALEADVKKFQNEANTVKVASTVDKLIKEKHILPAQKEEVFTVLFDSLSVPAEKKFKVKEKVDGKDTEKEVSQYDFLLATFSKGSVDVNTAMQTEAGERQDSEEVLIKKANEFVAKERSEGRTVSFKDALAHVSPEDKREEEK